MQKKLQTHFIRFQYICKYHLSAVMIGFLNKLHRYITHKNNTEEIVLRNTKHETLIKHLTGSNPEICKLNNRTLTKKEKRKEKENIHKRKHTHFTCVHVITPAHIWFTRVQPISPSEVSRSPRGTRERRPSLHSSSASMRLPMALTPADEWIILMDAFPFSFLSTGACGRREGLWGGGRWRVQYTLWDIYIYTFYL